jgi:DNA repair photolyase
MLERDAKKMAYDEREILFSFMSDPYQSDDAAALTRQALLICEQYHLKAQVLTKAGHRAVNDFDILARNGWKFGSTIIFKSEKLREQWEPGAPSIESRMAAVRTAHEQGIYTWVSVEPVVDPVEALAVLHELKPFVNFWKVGKLNYNKEVESRIDWKKFLADVRIELDGHDYYIKKDLLKYE